MNLPHWAGLKLTNKQHDSLWNDVNETDLLEAAGAIVEIDEQIDDAGPGMNDTYYTVYCSDVEEFRESLKTEILMRIEK